MEWSTSSEPWRHHYFWSFQLHESKQFPSSKTSFWLAFLLLATKILADSENKMASQRVSDQAATIQASSSEHKLSATRTALPLNKTWSLFECVCVCVCACACTQSCLTLCIPMVCSPPGSSLHGIFQARILEQFAISYSRWSSWPKDRTRVSCISCIGKQILTHLGSPGKPVDMIPFYKSCLLS